MQVRQSEVVGVLMMVRRLTIDVEMVNTDSSEAWLTQLRKDAKRVATAVNKLKLDIEQRGLFET